MNTRILLLLCTCLLLTACGGPHEKVVKEYLTASSPEERVNSICKSPDVSLADLKKEYASVDWRGLGNSKVEIDQEKSRKIDDSYHVLHYLWEQGDGSSSEGDMNVYEIDKNWCVDWLSLSRTPGFLVDDLYDKGGNGVGFFRVVKSNYYNYEFSGAKNSHYSLKVIDMDGLNLYLKKSEGGAQAVWDCVKGGDNYCTIKGTFSYPISRKDIDIAQIANVKIVQY